MSFNAAPPGGTTPSPKEGEVDKLSKENFNLKLKVYYLEEKLAKLRNNNPNSANSSAELEDENYDLKLELDQQQTELEDLKLLLAKSRSVIESLQTDLSLTRAELEESRNHEVNQEVVHQKDIEIDALKHRLREYENKDRQRMEDTLALNNQLRDAKEKAQFNQTEVQAARAQREELERKIAQLTQENAKLKAGLSDKAINLEKSSEEFFMLRDELDVARGKLVQNAKTLGDIRLREQDLSRQLQQCELERDRNMRSCALAERKCEDQEGLLDEARQTVMELQDKVSNLETEIRHCHEMYASKQNAVEAQNKLLCEEVRKESSIREMELKSLVAELKGKNNALESSKVDLHKLYTNEKDHAIALEEEVHRLREELSNVKQHSQVTGVGMEKMLEEKHRSLEDEINLRKKAEEELKVALSKSTQREKELRNQVHAWETQIVAKLDEFIPAAQQEESDQRPEPRRLSMEESNGDNSLKVLDEYDRKKLMMNKIDNMRNLKKQISNNIYDVEADMQSKIRDLAVKLERSESKLQTAEGKLEVFIQSMATFTKHKNSHMLGHHQQLEKRNESLLSELRIEKSGFDEKTRALETRLHRVIEEKDQLYDQIADSREKCAQMEGELRQAKVELGAVRDEKSNLNQRLEKLSGSRGILEENNRVMSLELQSRGKKLSELSESHGKVKQQIETLKQQIQSQEGIISALEHKLQESHKQIKNRERQLRDSKAKLERTVQKYSTAESNDFYQHDDFERRMWREVEETERAIRSRDATPKKRGNSLSSTGSGGYNYNLQANRIALEKNQEIFSEVLIAAAELVERTQSLLSKHSRANIAAEAHDLLRANHRLARDLQTLGQDVHSIQRMLLQNIGSGNHYHPQHQSSNQNISARPSTPTYLNSRITPDRRSTSRKRIDQGTPGLSSLHRDMLGRLGKIRSDLQDTATQLNFSKFE